MVVGLFLELDAPGGIQRAGRHVAAVLAEFARGRNFEYRLISLNDSRELHRMSVTGREFVFTGCERSKLRMGATALRAAWRGTRVVIAAHPHLAPLTRTMRVGHRRLRVVVCTHGIEVWQPLSRLRRSALQRADVVLGPSRDTAEHVAAQQQVPRDRIRVLPWALDPQFETHAVAAAAKVSLPGTFPSGRVILSVGRWAASERYKGMDRLIAALPRLLHEWPDLELVIAGEGDDRAWLEHLAAEQGVGRHVHLLSGLSQAELSACYAACEIFALPSRGEGFGMVYLEAMSHGKPVIAGAHGGAPEVVEDGVMGYLVPHGDAAQLITALRALLSDPVQAREMGARGRKRVERDFRFEAFAKALKRILREQCES